MNDDLVWLQETFSSYISACEQEYGPIGGENYKNDEKRMNDIIGRLHALNSAANEAGLAY